MLKAFRVIMKVDVVRIEDEKASGGVIQDVMVYEKDFGKTIESVVAEVLATMEKNQGA